MSTILVQPPPRVDLVEIRKDLDGVLRGKITRPWQLYLDNFFARAGGTTAPGNNELADMIGGAQMGIFSPRPNFIQSPPSIGYVHAFLPHRQEQSAPLADASAVLCSRVFAKR
jgi:hypothetical protein